MSSMRKDIRNGGSKELNGYECEEEAESEEQRMSTPEQKRAVQGIAVVKDWL